MNEPTRNAPAANLLPFDFAVEFARCPEAALRAFQLLLLDRQFRRAQIDSLRILNKLGQKEFGPTPRRRRVDYGQEIDLIRRMGLYAAYRDNQLTPDRIERLARLACDPDALSSLAAQLEAPVDQVTRQAKSVRAEHPSNYDVRQHSVATLDSTNSHRRASMPSSEHLVSLVKDMVASIVAEKPHLERGLYEDTWGYDRTWMVGKVRCTDEIGLPVRTWTHKYLTSMSLIDRRIWGQVHQKNKLLRAVGDAEWTTLSPDTVASLPFEKNWQKMHATALHRNLRKRGWTLDAFCESLQGLTGDDAYNELARLSEVSSYSKCLAFFIREALQLLIVPRDRHVRRILEKFELDTVPLPQLTCLIREAGFEPRLVARVLYEQGLQEIVIPQGEVIITPAAPTHTTPVAKGGGDKAPTPKVAGLPPLSEHKVSKQAMIAGILRTLNRQGQGPPRTPVEIKDLNGWDHDAVRIGWALTELLDQGRILRVGRGLYALP